MSYYVRQEENVFLVTENETGSVLARKKKLTQAERLTKTLNKGSGFEGFTPNFFIREEDDRNRFHG